VYPRIEDDLLAEAIAGKVRIFWHKQLIPLQLNTKERQEFEAAKSRRFVILRKGCRKNLSWAWSHYCENNALPPVILTPMKTSALVKMDLIAYGRLNAIGTEKVKCIASAALAPRVRRFYAGGVYNSVRVNLDESEAVAAAFYDIATEFKQ